jgi:hypothetical protein
MDWAKRLFSALLTLAIAQFGVLAAAPAHAHEEDGHHAIHAVHVVEAPAEWSAIVSDHHGHDHDEPSDVADNEGDEGRPKQGGSESVTHVHSCPQFTQANAQIIPVVALACVRSAWPASQAGPPTHASAPPLRPPRTFL